MTAYTALSDFLLYAVMAFIAGSVALRFAPAGKGREAALPPVASSLLCVAIPILAAAPVVQLTFLLAGEGRRMRAFADISTGFRAGHSFLLVSAGAVLLLLTIRFGASRWIQAVLAAASFTAIAYGSHSATIEEVTGFIGHAVHLTLLSAWAGIVLLVAWKPAAVPDWRGFLKWFTPLAASFMAVIIGTGIFLMLLAMKAGDYAASWILPYGQMLLLKHLGIIPLLAAAAINGFLADKTRPASAWLKVESLLLGLVLLFTSFMSKLAPPHDLDKTFKTEGQAPFTEWMTGAVEAPVRAQFRPEADGIAALVVALLCLALIPLAERRQLPGWTGAAAGIGFIAAAYLGLMLLVSF
ncbi:CopD family protein [Bhargavaea ullalensis]|uniref:Copper resistance protein D n=1 Tax=Bhargavaea ullalensis TaxID=1265685 RepID=A0ABV2GB59_9BACL